MALSTLCTGRALRAVSSAARLSQRMATSAKGAPGAVPAAPRPPRPTTLLPLPAAEDLDARTRWLLNDLREGDRRELDPVVPSLYRHLSVCPGLLEWLHLHLAPRFADVRMSADLHRLRQDMQQEASAWAQRLGPVPGVLLAADVLGTLEQFAREVIPPMVLIGTALRQAMDAGLRQRRL